MALGAYAALSAFIVAPESATAQIHYVDLDPDIFMPASPWMNVWIDLDTNSINDLEFRIGTDTSYSSGGSVSSWTYKRVLANAGAQVLEDYEGFPIQFSEGQNVEIDERWSNGGMLWSRDCEYTFSWYCWSVGNWKSEGFLPVRVPYEDQYRYGWIRVDVNNIGADYLAIKDYALEMTPGLPIRCGDTAYQQCPLPPSQFTTDYVGSSKATVKWQNQDSVSNYKYQVFDAELETLITAGVVSESEVMIDGLTPGLAYGIRVRPYCMSGTEGSWSKPYFFRTLAFGQPVIIEAIPAAGTRFDVADLDNDLDMDVAAIYPDAGELVWYENALNDSVWTKHLIATLPPGLTDIHMADVNNDSLIDIIVASRDLEGVSWIENRGSGVFLGWHDIVSSVKEVIRVDALDLNLDGDQDIVYSTGGSSNHVMAVFNLSGGYSWSKSRGISKGYRFAYGDIDTDGDFDIVVSKPAKFLHDGGFRLLMNDGMSFIDGPILAMDLKAVVELSIDDMNNDGMDDVVSIDQSSGRVILSRQTGSGSFEDPVVVYRGKSPNSLSTADINGNGLVDVLIGNSVEPEIAWLANIGDNGYQLQKVPVSAPLEMHLTLDMDRDGDVDLISCEQDGIKWYRNLRSIAILPKSGNNTIIAPPSHMVFPNPAVNRLQVHLQGDEDAVDLELIDAVGRVVQYHRMNGSMELDVSALPAGMYYVRLTSEQGREVHPVMIE